MKRILALLVLLFAFSAHSSGAKSNCEVQEVVGFNDYITKPLKEIPNGHHGGNLGEYKYTSKKELVLKIQVIQTSEGEENLIYRFIRFGEVISDGIFAYGDRFIARITTGELSIYCTI
jgi:hypothetical protein